MGFLTEQEIAELSPSELLPHATPIYGYVTGPVDWSAFS